jgi:hypothetical protein
MPSFTLAVENRSQTRVRTGLNSTVAHVDEEDIDSRLWGADHVFSRCDELNDSVVQLGTRPTIPGLVPGLIPIVQLWDFVRHAAHTAAPTTQDYRLAVKRRIE